MSHEAANIEEERIKRHARLVAAADALAWAVDMEDWKDGGSRRCDCNPASRCRRCKAVSRIESALEEYDRVRKETSTGAILLDEQE